jgi:hypothetical protein
LVIRQRFVLAPPALFWPMRTPTPPCEVTLTSRRLAREPVTTMPSPPLPGAPSTCRLATTADCPLSRMPSKLPSLMSVEAARLASPGLAV